VSQQSFIISDGALDVAVTNSIPIGTEVGLITRPIDPAEGPIGSILPTLATFIGASDGYDLRPLLVESSSNFNLRTSIFQGPNEAVVINYPAIGTEYGLGVRIIGSLSTSTATSTSTTITNIPLSISSQILLASNPNRRGGTIFNDAGATLYIKLGATASYSSYTVKLATNAYYEVPFNYTGRIDGVWEMNIPGGAALVTDLL
jgi:hypothetical protein